MPVLRENDSVEIEFRAEISGGDDILDRNCRRFDDINTKFTECLADSLEGGVNMINGGGASADDFSGSENEVGGFGVLDSIDEAGKVVGVVVAFGEVYRKVLEGEFVFDIGRGDDVFNGDRLSESRHSAY